MTALTTLSNTLAERFGMGSSPEVLDILKATVFKGQNNTPPTDAQMTALLVVANQFNLNPFTKEIYAYPDKQNGIVPVVGVDGWSRIINDHPQFDGMEFNYSEETVQHKGKTCHAWIECVMYRKDRTRPTVVREMFAEVARSVSFTTPWDTHPNRMHRHKAMIQCARLAFGFGGIYDDDEAQRIVEIDVVNAETGQVESVKRGPQRKSERQEPPAAEPQAAQQAQAQDGAEEVVSQAQAAYLRKKVAAAGKEESAVLAAYKVEKFEDLPATKFEEVKGVLK